MARTRNARGGRLGPRDMPQLRADLVGGFAGTVTKFDKGILEIADSGFSDIAVGNARALRTEAAAWQQALSAGVLWWVSPEMTEVAATAATSLPNGELDLLDEDADPSGLIFWAGPTGVSLPWAKSPDEHLTVSAFGPPTAPRLPVVAMAWRKVGPNLRFAAFTNDPRAVKAAKGPIPRAGIVEFDISGETTTDEIRVFNAILRATHALALQPGIGQLQQETATARGHGTGHAREPQEVTVVHLRRPASSPRPDNSPASERRYTHRWIVGGHWRNQAVGRKRAERRLTWIAPHIKGPKDKALVLKDRVNVLDS